MRIWTASAIFVSGVLFIGSAPAFATEPVGRVVFHQGVMVSKDHRGESNGVVNVDCVWTQGMGDVTLTRMLYNLYHTSNFLFVRIPGTLCEIIIVDGKIRPVFLQRVSRLSLWVLTGDMDVTMNGHEPKSRFENSTDITPIDKGICFYNHEEVHDVGAFWFFDFSNPEGIQLTKDVGLHFVWPPRRTGKKVTSRQQLLVETLGTLGAGAQIGVNGDVATNSPATKE